MGLKASCISRNSQPDALTRTLATLTRSVEHVLAKLPSHGVTQGSNGDSLHNQSDFSSGCWVERSWVELSNSGRAYDLIISSLRRFMQEVTPQLQSLSTSKNLAWNIWCLRVTRCQQVGRRMRFAINQAPGPNWGYVCYRLDWTLA